MQGNLETLRKIIFECNKIAQYSARKGDVRTCLILCEEGLWKYMFSDTIKLKKHLIGWKDLTDERWEIKLLLEKLPDFQKISETI